VIPGKQFAPSDILALLRRRTWLLVLPCVLLGIATVFITRRLPDQFRSETLILVVPQRVPESYVKSTVTARIEDRLQSISQQILSRTNLERIINDFNLYAQDRRIRIMEDVVEQMRKNAIEIQVIKGDSFRISFTGAEPKSVMQVTERLASLFIDENLRDRENQAEGSYQFLEAQLDDARRRLVEHEKKLEEYRRRYSGQLPSQLPSNLQAMQNMQLQIQSLSESAARDRDRRLMLERQINDVMQQDLSAAAAPGPRVPGDASGETAAGAVTLQGTPIQQLDAARQALQQLELRLKPDHPDVTRLKRTITSLEQKVAADTQVMASSATPVRASSPAELAKQNRLRELKAEMEHIDLQLAYKEREEKQLRANVAAYQARVDATPARESELTELTRDYGTLQTTYTTLLQKKEDSKVAANMERNQIGEQFKILDPARMPEKPYSPDRPKLNMMGAGAGLLVGLALAVLLEYSDSTLKSEDDVVRSLALPVLALMPVIVTPADRRRSKRRRWAIAVASSATVVVLMALVAWKLRS
jgi:polysaccharide chain length determinant protein (PEP-CTERM system associated)